MTRDQRSTLSFDGVAGVTGLPTPSAASDAATKAYVDGQSVVLVNEDFLGGTVGSRFTASASGTGASVRENAYGYANGNSMQDAPGVLNCSTGTTTSGFAYAWMSDAATLRFGGGAWRFRARVRVSALSDGSNTYVLIVGFGLGSSTAPTDGVYAYYLHSVNSGKWRATTANNSSTSTADMGTGPTTASWQWIGIDVNAAGTSADFRIGSTLAACDAASPTNITTNIPTTRNTSIVVGIGKGGVGTTDRALYVDRVEVTHVLTTAR